MSTESVALVVMEKKLGPSAYALWRHLIELRGEEGFGFASQSIGGITRFLPAGMEWAISEVYKEGPLGGPATGLIADQRDVATQRARRAWRRLQRFGLLERVWEGDTKTDRFDALDRGDVETYAKAALRRDSYRWVPHGRVAGEMAIIPTDAARTLETASGHGGARPGAGRPRGGRRP